MQQIIEYIKDEDEELKVRRKDQQQGEVLMITGRKRSDHLLHFAIYETM